MRRVVSVLVTAVALQTGVVDASPPSSAVAIRGTSFYVNGTETNRGSAAAGLLLNSRMVQAAFDDANPSTASTWTYGDTHRWSARRNTRELINALPSFARAGLNAITVNLQGGSTGHFAQGDQENITSAFRGDGSLKPRWITRLDALIRAAAAQRIVVILGFFYFGQDELLADDRSVIAATDAATAWLVARRYRNVLVEIDNEANIGYDHAVLRPERVAELIRRVQRRSHNRLLVSTSLSGGVVPPSTVLEASDFVLLHGNGLDPAGLAALIEKVRAMPAYRKKPKPIVINEDSTNVANLRMAVAKHVSWGYYDQKGFQTPPVDWRIDTPEKTAFFNAVRLLTRR